MKVWTVAICYQDDVYAMTARSKERCEQYMIETYVQQHHWTDDPDKRYPSGELVYVCPEQLNEVMYRDFCDLLGYRRDVWVPERKLTAEEFARMYSYIHLLLGTSSHEQAYEVVMRSMDYAVYLFESDTDEMEE